MNSVQSLDPIKNLTRNRKFWVLLSFCWLLSGFLVIIHEQQHQATDDIQCQFCLSSLKNTPFVSTSGLSFNQIEKSRYFFDDLYWENSSSSPLTVSNRGPPSL